MTRISALILIALLSSGCAVNGEWTRQDTALEIAWQVVNAADAYSTANIRNTPDWRQAEGHPEGVLIRLEEHTPLTRSIIGARPEPSDTYQYFITTAISHWLISRSLPKKWRPWFQGGTTLISAEALKRNCDHGLCPGGDYDR